MIKNVILGFLMYKNLTGYEIKQMMNKSTKNFMNASFGSIYPALSSLEKEGFVTSTNEIENGKYKKIYTIHDLGKSQFIKWLEEPINFMNTYENILAKVFFFRYIPLDTCNHLVQKLIDDVRVKINELLELSEIVKEEAGYYEMSTLRFGLDHLKFIEDWYTTFLVEMKENKS